MQRLSPLAKHLFAPLPKLGQPEMTSINLENVNRFVIPCSRRLHVLFFGRNLTILRLPRLLSVYPARWTDGMVVCGIGSWELTQVMVAHCDCQ